MAKRTGDIYFNPDLSLPGNDVAFFEGQRLKLLKCQNTGEKLALVVYYRLNTPGHPEQAKVIPIELRQIDETINEGIS